MQHEVHRARPGLAQRAGGQQPAVAHTLVVKNADLHVTRQGQVLEAVVADQHVDLRVRRQQRLASLCPPGGHEDRHTGGTGDQQRFVTHFGCRAGGHQHRAHLAALAAVAARDDAGPPAGRLQVAHQGDGHGGLAGAAGDHVAHHDDGHRQARAGQHARRIQRAAQGRQPSVGQGQGPEQPCQRPAVLPGLAQAGAHGCFKASRLALGCARGLGGEGDLRQAHAARGLHHRDHRLVRGRGVGADDDHVGTRAGIAGGGRA